MTWRSLPQLLEADSDRVWDEIGAQRLYVGEPGKSEWVKPAADFLTPEEHEKRLKRDRFYQVKNRYDTCACGERKRSSSKTCRACYKESLGRRK